MRAPSFGPRVNIIDAIGIPFVFTAATFFGLGRLNEYHRQNSKDNPAQVTTPIDVPSTSQDQHTEQDVNTLSMPTVKR